MAWRVNYGVNHPDETATFRLADGLELFIQHHGDHITIRQEGARTVGLVVRPVAANVIEIAPDATASATERNPMGIFDQAFGASDGSDQHGDEAEAQDARSRPTKSREETRKHYEKQEEELGKDEPRDGKLI